MKQLVFAELKRLVPTFLVIYLVSGFVAYYWDMSFLLILIPAYCVILSTFILKRSAWYLILPWSRTKIVLTVMLQNLIIFLTNIMLVGIIFAIKGTVFFGEHGYYQRWMAILGYLAAFLFTSFRSLTGMQTKRHASLGHLNAKQVLGTFVVAVAIPVFVWRNDLLKEPTFGVAILLVIVASIFSAIFREFILPASTARLANRVTALMLCGLFSFIILSSIVLANWDSRKYYSENALSFLGKFPSFVSEERALSLFIKTDVGPNATMTRHLEFLQKQVDAEAWKARTIACKSGDCLDLSADVAKLNALPVEELEDRFHTLMSFCEFQLGVNGRNVCIKRIKMDNLHMREWLVQLEKAEVLKRWISSGDPKKQILALKGMSFSNDPVQENSIRQLEDSKDPRVKTAAMLFLQNSKKVSESSLDCNSKKDEDNSVCKFKNNEYSL